jgi:diacylglycerol kinase
MRNSFIKSFGFAINGIKFCFKNEFNFKIHILATMIVLVLGIVLSISITEWMIVIACIAIVLMAELFNTAIENLCNKIEPNIHPQIKIIKDVSAAAVLVVAIAAATIGILIFIPKIF